MGRSKSRGRSPGSGRERTDASPDSDAAARISSLESTVAQLTGELEEARRYCAGTRTAAAFAIMPDRPSRVMLAPACPACSKLKGSASKESGPQAQNLARSGAQLQVASAYVDELKAQVALLKEQLKEQSM